MALDGSGLLAEEAHLLGGHVQRGGHFPQGGLVELGRDTVNELVRQFLQPVGQGEAM
jgi:hypothetical protein